MLEKREIIAMSVAAISEEMHVDVKNVRVLSFNEIQKSSLEKYLEENRIEFNKFKLGDELL